MNINQLRADALQGHNKQLKAEIQELHEREKVSRLMDQVMLAALTGYCTQERAVYTPSYADSPGEPGLPGPAWAVDQAFHAVDAFIAKMNSQEPDAQPTL